MAKLEDLKAARDAAYAAWYAADVAADVAYDAWYVADAANAAEDAYEAELKKQEEIQDD